MPIKYATKKPTIRIIRPGKPTITTSGIRYENGALVVNRPVTTTSTGERSGGQSVIVSQESGRTFREPVQPDVISVSRPAMDLNLAPQPAQTVMVKASQKVPLRKPAELTYKDFTGPNALTKRTTPVSAANFPIVLNQVLFQAQARQTQAAIEAERAAEARKRVNQLTAYGSMYRGYERQAKAESQAIIQAEKERIRQRGALGKSTFSSGLALTKSQAKQLLAYLAAEQAGGSAQLVSRVQGANTFVQTTPASRIPIELAKNVGRTYFTKEGWSQQYQAFRAPGGKAMLVLDIGSAYLGGRALGALNPIKNVTIGPKYVPVGQAIRGGIAGSAVGRGVAVVGRSVGRGAVVVAKVPGKIGRTIVSTIRKTPSIKSSQIPRLLSGPNAIKTPKGAPLVTNIPSKYLTPRLQKVLTQFTPKRGGQEVILAFKNKATGATYIAKVRVPKDEFIKLYITAIMEEATPLFKQYVGVESYLLRMSARSKFGARLQSIPESQQQFFPRPTVKGFGKDVFVPNRTQPVGSYGLKSVTPLTIGGQRVVFIRYRWSVPRGPLNIRDRQLLADFAKVIASDDSKQAAVLRQLVNTMAKTGQSTASFNLGYEGFFMRAGGNRPFIPIKYINLFGEKVPIRDVISFKSDTTLSPSRIRLPAPRPSTLPRVSARSGGQRQMLVLKTVPRLKQQFGGRPRIITLPKSAVKTLSMTYAGARPSTRLLGGLAFAGAGRGQMGKIFATGINLAILRTMRKSNTSRLAGSKFVIMQPRTRMASQLIQRQQAATITSPQYRYAQASAQKTTMRSLLKMLPQNALVQIATTAGTVLVPLALAAGLLSALGGGKLTFAGAASGGGYGNQNVPVYVWQGARPSPTLFQSLTGIGGGRYRGFGTGAELVR